MQASEPRDSSDDPFLPTSYPPSTPPPTSLIYEKKRSPIYFFSSRRIGTRIAIVVILSLLLLIGLHFVRPEYTAKAAQAFDWAQQGWGTNDHSPSPTTTLAANPTATGIDKVDSTDDGAKDRPEWTTDQLRAMVSHTKGYYVRDWSLGLGWNNMRYIIEASLLHAKLLNRTLVLPSFVYARGCEFAHEVCASYAEEVDRFKAVGWKRDSNSNSEFQPRQLEEGEYTNPGWRIPIEYMLDFPHLRSAQPVVLTSEYLVLHGLSPEVERSNGAWDRNGYHNSDPSPSLFVIPNSEYDPQTILRVDVMPKGLPSGWTDEGQLIQARLQLKKGRNLGLMEWDDVRNLLRGIGNVNVDDDAQFVESLRGAGLQPLYTFQGSRGIDLIKHVVEPLNQIAPVTMLRGLVDDYAHVTEDVLLLEGETHLFRKPGNLRFTTEAARRDFESIVLVNMKPAASVMEVGERVAERMGAKVGGRMWMAGHLRRGDFVDLGWALEHDIDKHLKIITDGLESGRHIVAKIKADGDWHIAPVPGTKAYEDIWRLDLPHPNASFYLATDERSPEALAYVRQQGALLFTDVLDPTDRRLYGWELLFSDIVMLVEQVVMSHAAFFYGYGASSVAGGTLNQRAARGMDPRTGVAE